MALPDARRAIPFERIAPLATATSTTTDTGGIDIPDKGRFRHMMLQLAEVGGGPVYVVGRLGGRGFDMKLASGWVRGNSVFSIAEALAWNGTLPYDLHEARFIFRIRNDTGATVTWVGRVVIEFD